MVTAPACAADSRNAKDALRWAQARSVRWENMDLPFGWLDDEVDQGDRATARSPDDTIADAASAVVNRR